MKFFIALFGVLLCGVALLKRSKDRKRAQERDEILKSQFDYLFKKVNYMRQAEIRDYVYSGQHVEEIYEILNEDLVAVLGERYIKYPHVFSLPGTPGYVFNEDRGKFNDNAYWAIALLLAHEGIIPSDVMISGLPLGNGYIYDNKMFCKRIEELLNENGVEIKLYLREDDGEPRGSTRMGMMVPKTINVPDNALRLW